MDTLLGTSHYVEPSPHRLARARRDQAAKASSSQPSLRGAKPKRYPFTHRVGGPPSRPSSRQRRASGAGSAGGKSALHIMAPSADTPMVAQDAAKLLWREWVDGKRREEAAYDSVALKLESRMARAAVLSQRHGQVNSLRTAVAFDCLDQLGKVFGRYGTVFRTIRADSREHLRRRARLLGSRR